MLKTIGHEVDQLKEKVKILHHRHIAVASFFIATETTSYLGFEYVRYTVEELLCTHVALGEQHIRAIAIPVRQKRSSALDLPGRFL